MTPLDEDLAEATLQSLERRFGLRWVAHRMGALRLRFAEVREVDRCVHALYPRCLVGHGDAPVWMISWPAAFGLAEHLVNELSVAGENVLELGCGTAVAGVSAAAAGAAVLATDYDLRALAVARRNGLENDVAGLRLGRLDWYEGAPPDRFEWILGSEITYHQVAFEPLLALLGRSLAPGGRVLLSDIHRRQTDSFVTMAEERGWSARSLDRVVHLERASHRIRLLTLTRR